MAAEKWTDQEKDILAYALKYFEIHAAQRMSVFNFFIVLSTIILTGLATCVFGEGIYAPIGIPLGLLLSALALTFWKLDQRTSFLVKRAEKALTQLESDHFPAFGKIIGNEPAEFQKLNEGLSLIRKRWTYSTSLGLVFIVVGTMGLAGTALAAAKATQVADWLDKSTGESEPNINVELIQYQEHPANGAVAPKVKKEEAPRGRPAQASH
jgi:hypothetical protein